MRNVLHNRIIVTYMIVASVIILLVSPVLADYEISWHTIDGGGGTSTGGTYEVTGTIGQHDADTGQMSGGDYTLSGGFWPGGLFQQCFVDFEHFVQFAMYWLDTPCNIGNNFCQGSDLDFSTAVEINDVGELGYYWLDNCPLDWPWQ